ncbi:MAG: hypothetical protein FD145_451 [Candidatus Saganbacteria bacterium]|uniref:PorV/PorQ family protein n=1 Tax=Candidatus Saganbacteria bacterium TaxID=2575572 RepID=A0A833L1T6_UNCSA|nr:MAG: hypothetical protein FD145_451 [Candidatus Saganbacteria bacterium]
MKNIICCLLFVFLFTNVSLANYGARPMAMGGAFTAVADDANTAYWNPAGFAINPGVDVYGSLLLSNRNERIGDNMAAVKLCFEADFDPFAWIIGVGAVSLFALDSAKYLSDQGLLKKNWGREKTEKEEAVSEKVLEKGEEKTVPVGQQAKEKAKGIAKEMLAQTTQVAKIIAKESARQVYWGQVYYPWYHYNASRPTYWDKREAEYSPSGKAQFAGGITWITDKNPSKSQSTDYYTFSLATGYEERVALGANVNIYNIGITASNGTILKGYGAGIDLGILIRPIDQIAWGATAKEILTSDVRFENGATVTYKMSINTGIAISPIDDLTISADLHNFFRQSADPQTSHYGVEYRPFEGLALRAGLNDNSKTAGASIMVGGAIIDYTILGGIYNRTQIAGLTWKF